MRQLSIAEARRVALAAQGLAEPRPSGRITLRHLRKVVEQVGVVQLDSVNVVARAHYLTFFARLGNYPMELVDRLGWETGEMVEYWAHEASLIPIADWPLFRYRMDADLHWASMRRWLEANPSLVNEVLSEIRTRGPLRPADFDHHATRQRGPWWSWSDAKRVLEGLFFTGRLTVAERINFARLYDLPERVLPKEVIAARVGEAEARRTLILKAVRHHGLGTAADFADYYRMGSQSSGRILSQLALEGEVIPVEVEGWKGPVYRHPEARLPRKVEGVALLAPFDPVVWFRPRVERLFNFHYRIEIYTPPPRRTFGYYVFPILLDGDLVGRIDLKGDRQQGALLARGSYLEQGQDARRVAPWVASELRTMAAWLGLADVVVEKRGSLAAVLRKEVG